MKIKRQNTGLNSMVYACISFAALNPQYFKTAWFGRCISEVAKTFSAIPDPSISRKEKTKNGIISQIISLFQEKSQSIRSSGKAIV